MIINEGTLFNQLKNLKTDEEKNKKPDSFPVLLGLAYNENFISSYLAYLLNPQKSKIGMAFIQEFYKKWESDKEDKNDGPPYQKIEDESVNPDDFKIIREFYLSERSRIDIWIEYKGEPIVVIENKIYSCESVYQTINYTEDIRKRFPESNPICYLLSPKGNEPMQKAERFNAFLKLSYKDIHNIIHNIKIEGMSNDEEVILKNFIQYIEDKFMRNEIIAIPESTKHYIDNHDTIKKIEKSINDIYSQCFAIIENQYESIFKSEGANFIFNWNESRSWQIITKKSWNQNSERVHFELNIDKSNLIFNGKYEVMIHFEKDSKRIIEVIFNNQVFQNLISTMKGYKFYPNAGKNALISKEIKPGQVEVLINNIEMDTKQVYEDFKKIFQIIDSHYNEPIPVIMEE